MFLPSIPIPCRNLIPGLFPAVGAAPGMVGTAPHGCNRVPTDTAASAKLPHVYAPTGQTKSAFQAAMQPGRRLLLLRGPSNRPHTLSEPRRAYSISANSWASR